MLKIRRTADSVAVAVAVAVADKDTDSHCSDYYCRRTAAGRYQGLAAVDSAAEESIDCSSSL